MGIAEKAAITHSRPIFHQPLYVITRSDGLFNRLPAPGEAHPDEVISFLQAAEIVPASEFISSSKVFPASEFHILDSPPVFGRVERSFLGCRIRCEGHVLLLTTDPQTGVCWVGGGLSIYLVYNCAIDFAAAQRTAVCGVVYLDDYFLDLAHGSLVRRRCCPPSKVLHHFSKAVEEGGVLVTETGNPGPKQKIKFLPA